MLFFTMLLGTLGLTGIGIVSEQVQTKLKHSAKEILTSDLVVGARRDLFEKEKHSVEEIFKTIPHEHYRVVDIYSMVTHVKTKQSRLAEVRGIEKSFPFYGKIELKEGVFTPQGLFVSRDLENLWRIDAGDELKIGDYKTIVGGIVKNDTSQGLRGFSLAPRIYISLEALEKSGLLKPGATGSFAYHYFLPSLTSKELDNLKERLLKVLPDVAVKVTLPEESSEQTGRVLNYLTDFMALSALIGLILSFVGVFYLYQSYLMTRLKDFCLLNLYGLDKRHIILGTLLQFSSVFILVFFVQLFVIIPLYKIFAPFLSGQMGMDLAPRVEFSSVLSLLPFLYGLALTILIPLLMGLMRTSMGVQLKSPKISLGRFRIFDFIPFTILLWAFASYLSHSYQTGSYFFLALMIVFTLSAVFIQLSQWFLKKMIMGRGLLIPTIEGGIALRNFTRSGHKLTLSFLSLTMGATLISLIFQLDHTIQKEFTLDEKKPGLFLFDIQEEQLEALLDFSQKEGVTLDGVTPMIRARLEKINDEAFTRVESGDTSLRTREDEVESRFRNRGINLTYRQHLGPGEKMVEGTPFPITPDLKRPAHISLEKKFASRLKLKLGDKVSFDVQGVEVDGIVTSFREVKWTSFYPNFFVNVEPGFIDEAPKTYLAVLAAHSVIDKAQFQRRAVEKFPNISFIDIEELTGKLSLLFDKSRRAIEVISWLSLAVGMVILYGLSHDQVYRRYYDLALMKSLGFSAQSLRLHLLWEFGSLFTVALGLGFFLGWFMAQMIGREVFKLPLTIDWWRIFIPGFLLIILCLVTILTSSWKVLRARPRELLSDA